MSNVTPYPFQEEGVQFALRHHYSINAFMMGLGKSLVALLVAERTKLPTFIVCPAFLVGTWEEEIAKFDIDIDLVKISSYASVGKYEEEFKRSEFIICDEVHMAKNLEAKRTQKLHELITKYKPERFLGLSGTPVKNRVPEFFSLIALCSYNPKNTSGQVVFDKFPNYWAFARHFCNVKEFRIGRRRVTKFEGVRNTPELLKLLEGKYLRRKASEVLDLPPIIRKDILLNNKEVDENLLAAWNEGKKAFATFKKNSARVKMKNTATYCKDLLEQGEGPLVVFSDHVDPILDFPKHLKKYKVEAITGDTPLKVRDKIKRDFQEGLLDVVAATIGSFSVGVTLTRASNLILNDFPHVPGDIAQLEKRIHRIGQSKRCVIHRILWGATDHRLCKNLDEKIKVLAEVL